MYRVLVVCWLVGALGLAGCASVPPSTGGPPIPDVEGDVMPSQAALHTGFAALDRLLLEGEAQRKAGQLAAAASTLERAMRLAPRAPEVYVALARVQLDQRDYGKAEQMAQRALSWLGDSADAADGTTQARRQRAEAWSIIARARRAAGDIGAAQDAERRAIGIW